MTLQPGSMIYGTILACLVIVIVTSSLTSSPSRTISSSSNSSTSSSSTSTTTRHHRRTLTSRNGSDTSTPKPRGYNILTLGGSITWGAKGDIKKYENRDFKLVGENYPHLLTIKNHLVTNAAIRATGSDYPSHCIQSMVGERIYDVIIMEFSLNGIRGLRMLLRRLRDRFPDAILIYVDLYSLQIESVDAEERNPLELESRDPSLDWMWGAAAEHHRVQTEHYFGRVLNLEGGYVFSLPRYETPMQSLDMFGDDWHHLSPKGHQIVADGIIQILDSIPRNTPMRIGTWGRGDMCINWLMTGNVSLEYSGEASLRRISNYKHALGFFGPANITVVNPFPYRVQLYLAFLIKGDEYPITDIIIGGDQYKQLIPRYVGTGHTVRVEEIGVAVEGRNVMTITPNMETAMIPFRLTGVILCGECYRH